jgi:hypothetical protein
MVGTVDESAGGKCVEGSGSMVTGWGRIRGETKADRVDEKGQNE